MSRLDELIQKYCPNGVEYKKLEELSNISIGEFVHKNKQNKNGKYPVYNGGKENTGFYDEYNNIGKKIIISARGANAGYVNKVLTNYWSGNSCYTLNIKDNKCINWLYLYYFLKKQENNLIKNQQSGSIPALSKKQLGQVLIPLPPRPIQEEIVRILDSFTKLNEKLNEELTKRKNQYEYYRDNLLSFKDKSIYLPLEQILKIKNGKDYKHLNIGKIPVYGTGGIITYVDKYTYNKPSVLIPRKGSLEKLYYLDTPFWNVDTVFYTEIFNNVVEKYVFYCLQKEHLEKLNTAGGVPSLTQRVLNKVRIPVPSLDKQKYIVSILDKFNILCNDLLPAEIEARKKQYEYYRDKLLTFKELKQ